MQKSLSLGVSAMLLMLVLTHVFGFSQAKTETPLPSAQGTGRGSPPPSAAAPAMTPQDLGSFIDGLVPVEIERRDIAGCVVTVVKDGEVVFSRGYGHADVEKKLPVSDSRTLFRVGSISKLFTWTAVMQLVEQGRLDLDKDVNEYLDFRIPPAFGQPIRLRQLLTHTPGFEESVRNLFVESEAGMMPLRDYLTGHLPQRIFPPGTVPAYSNYGTALAGYIVQRTSGVKFEDYVDREIFQPLGMARASFAQPLPESLRPLMSNGYQLASGGQKPFEFVACGPAGALSASAQDIARFMIAHLQDGELDGRRILRAETARLMHSRQFALSPELNGMALGFYEESRNGQRIIGHGGDTLWFHSDLHLMPGQNLGFFVSYNSAGRGEGAARSALWQHLLDRYFPYALPAPTATSGKAGAAHAVAGTYLVSRRSQTNILRLMAILGETTLSEGAGGTLVAESMKGFDGQPKKFREIAPLTYRDVNGQDRIVFIPEASGRGYTAGVTFPAMAFQSVAWYQHRNFVVSVLAGSVGVFALTLIFWPVAALVRRHYGRSLALSPSQRRWRLAVRLVCVLVVLALAAWVLALTVGVRSVPTSKTDTWIRIAQVATLLATIASLLPVVGVSRSWSAGRWWWDRIWDGLLAFAGVGFTWVVLFGNLLQWQLRY